MERYRVQAVMNRADRHSLLWALAALGVNLQPHAMRSTVRGLLQAEPLVRKPFRWLCGPLPSVRSGGTAILDGLLTVRIPPAYTSSQPSQSSFAKQDGLCDSPSEAVTEQKR
jgi:hypothetical protein